MTKNRWIRFPDDEWGALIIGSYPPKYGDNFSLIKAKGGFSSVKIKEVVVSYEGKHFCRIIYRNDPEIDGPDVGDLASIY